MTEPKPPSQFIIDHQARVRATLPFDDKRDLVGASRGLRGRLVPNIVNDDQGEPCGTTMRFMENEAPDTANPSLWWQSRLVHLDGLYHVTDGIYQVRGLNLSNTTFIEGKEGLIIIDPLTSQKTGAAAFAFYQEHRGTERTIKAIIYTHSHVDHFGGV